MDSFTAMSREAIDATVTAQLATGEKYPMELNGTDFANLVHALRVAWMYADLDGTDDVTGEPLTDWIMGFVSGIGQTLGVENI